MVYRQGPVKSGYGPVCPEMDHATRNRINVDFPHQFLFVSIVVKRNCLPVSSVQTGSYRSLQTYGLFPRHTEVV